MHRLSLNCLSIRLCLYRDVRTICRELKRCVIVTRPFAKDVDHLVQQKYKQVVDCVQLIIHFKVNVNISHDCHTLNEENM